MPTIVEYRDGTPAMNDYPERITSPTTPRDCCATHMALIGEPCEEGLLRFQYKRCAQCGFTVRVMLGTLPDPQLVASLRATFAHSFGRPSAPGDSSSS